ncbi:amidohydrolase [Myxococcus sp. K15C18031901]|uniref:amidohydrolase family protein n=1 Tax=Myxococcus dinghuensis TaxID=2906761 RepID=UPI0020A77004|nr:amidohydrolase family protein [Myxococcus dinghuensis]MCP3103386.1 amidohydrolase [Myxococcus dinghuensis]
MSPHGKIDVHHHVIPPAFSQAMERHGLREVAGAPLPRWTPTRSLSVMEENDIATALLSLSCPGVYFGDLAEAVDLARRCNDSVAELTRLHPGRFGSFAVLPMPFVEESCAEAIRALDVLHADGVVLLGSTEGVFLGAPRLEELMAELDARGATVFVHPNLHATSTTLGLEGPGFLLEFLCDTTRAALNLILTGTMERYPRIRFILAHAGGFLPYAAWRLSLANLMPPYDTQAPQGILTYLRRFYFDTALSPGAPTLAALREFVDPSHLLFGSDFPFAPEPITALQVKTLKESHVLSPDLRAGVDRAHALRLFPRYASASEHPEPLPTPPREAALDRVKRLLRRPLVSVAQRLRDR